jgi:membrane protein YdbS with pleckstrin-like domain
MNHPDKKTITEHQGDEGRVQVFLPSPRLKLMYLSYLFLIVWALVIPVVMAVSIFLPPSVSLPVSVAALLIVLLALAWIRKYYSSISYHFGKKHIIRSSGVLSKKTMSVPWDQVIGTNIRRGMLHRLFGFARVDLLTTDEGVVNGRRVLLSVDGVESPEALETMIEASRRF